MITNIVNKLNNSKIGLHFRFECNEPEKIIYIVKSSEAIFDIELDREISHLAFYDDTSHGDFRGWICKDAERKMQSLISALTRYWKIKENSLSKIMIEEH